MGFFTSKPRGPAVSVAVASTLPENQAGPSKKLWQTGTLRNRAARTELPGVRPSPVKNQDAAGAPQLSLNLGDSSPALVNLDTSSSPWVDLGDDGSNGVKGLLGLSDIKPGRVNSRLKVLLDDAKLTVEQTTNLVQDCTAVLRHQGLATLGLFRPWRLAEDPYLICRALGFFLHTSSPDGPAIPLAEADFLRFGQATFQDVLADIGPHNVAACLKWGLRHLRYGPGGFSDVANPAASWQFYTTFAQREEAADLPKDAYSKLLVSSLPESHGKLLTAVLDLISLVSAHTDETAMTGSHLCGLLAFWLFNRQQAAWNSVEDLYTDFQTASTALEHFFLCYLRSQDKLPLRLSELLHSYPLGRQRNVNALGVRPFLHSTDEWPSLFAIVSLGEEFPSRLPSTSASKKRKLPSHIISDALLSESPSDADQNLLEDWQKLADVCKHGNTVILHDVLSEETQRIFDVVAAKAASKAQARQIKWQDASGSCDRRRSTSLKAGVRMHSASDSGHGKMPTGSSMGTLQNTHLPPLSRSTSAKPVSWTDFEKNGFLADEYDADTFSLLTDFGPTSPTTESASHERPNKLKKMQYPAVKSAKAERLLMGPSQDYEYEPEAKDEHRDAEIQQLRVLPLNQAFVEMYQDSLDDIRVTATWPIFAVAELKPLGPPYRALLVDERRTAVTEKADLEVEAVESKSKEVTSKIPVQPSKKEKKGLLSLNGRRKRASDLFARKGSNDSSSNLSTTSEVPTEVLPALDEFGRQRVRPMRAVTESELQREPLGTLPQPSQRPIPVIIKTSPLTPPRYFPARSQTMPASPSTIALASGKRVPVPDPENTDTEATASKGELQQPEISQLDGQDVFAVQQAASVLNRKPELEAPDHAATCLREEASLQPPVDLCERSATTGLHSHDIKITGNPYVDEADTTPPERSVNGQTPAAREEATEAFEPAKLSNVAEPAATSFVDHKINADSPTTSHPEPSSVECESRPKPMIQEDLSHQVVSQVKTGENSADIAEPPEAIKPVVIDTALAETKKLKATEVPEGPLEVDGASPHQPEVGVDPVEREEEPTTTPAANPPAASLPATVEVEANGGTVLQSETDVAGSHESILTPEPTEVVGETGPASNPQEILSQPAAPATTVETQKDIERVQLDKDIERALNARKKSISSISRSKLRSVSSTSLASEGSQPGQSTPTRPLQTRPSLILTGPDSPSSPGSESGETNAKKIGASFNRVSPTLKARLAGTFRNDTPADPQSPVTKAQKLEPSAEPSSPSKRYKLLSEAKRFLNRKKSTPDVAVKAVPASKEPVQHESVAIEQAVKPPLAEESSLTTSSGVKVEPTVLTPVSEAPSEATIVPEQGESRRDENPKQSSVTESTEPASDRQLSIGVASSLPTAGESDNRDGPIEQSTASVVSSTLATTVQDDLKEDNTSTEDLASTTMSDDVDTPDIRSRTPGAFFTPFLEILEPVADANKVTFIPGEQTEDPAPSNMFGSLASLSSVVTETVTGAAQSVLPESMGGHHEGREAGTIATDEGFDEAGGIVDKPAEAAIAAKAEELSVHPAEALPPVQDTYLMRSTASDVLEEARDTHNPTMRQSPLPAAEAAGLKTEQPSAEPVPAVKANLAAEQRLAESNDERPIDIRPTTRVQDSTSTALARARAILEKRRNVSGGRTASAGTEASQGSPVPESRVESGTDEG